MGCRSGELVPGADSETVVTSVDMVAHQWPQLDRNRPVMLNGKIGDAPGCIHPVRRRKSVGWADIQASRAGATVIGHRSVTVQFQIGIDFAKQQPRAVLA